MTDEPNTTPHANVLVMTATATVTLAVGITLALLLGYVGAPPATPESEVMSAPAPRVVLVPVQTATPDEAVPLPDLSPRPHEDGAHQHREHREHREHRGHEGHERDDESEDFDG